MCSFIWVGWFRKNISQDYVQNGSLDIKLYKLRQILPIRRPKLPQATGHVTIETLKRQYIEKYACLATFMGNSESSSCIHGKNFPRTLDFESASPKVLLVYECLLHFFGKSLSIELLQPFISSLRCSVSKTLPHSTQLLSRSQQLSQHRRNSALHSQQNPM